MKPNRAMTSEPDPFGSQQTELRAHHFSVVLE
jgi:hypothetical protein